MNSSGRQVIENPGLAALRATNFGRMEASGSGAVASTTSMSMSNSVSSSTFDSANLLSATFTAGSKGWLLRLFQSAFFNSWMGVQYLHRYPEVVGIQFYLCEKLKTLPAEGVEFLLPQLCHMLVCGRFPSRPLEIFMLDICKRSLHTSICTLWYLENYLADFGMMTKETRLYERCARLLAEFQAVIFRELLASLPPHLSPLRSLALVGGQIDELPNVQATLVGFGTILGSIGSPDIIEDIRPLVLMEARKPEKVDEAYVSRGGITLSRSVSGDELALQSSKAAKEVASSPSNAMPYRNRLTPLSTSSPSLEELHRGKAFSLKQYLVKVARHMSVTPPAFLENPFDNGIGQSGMPSRSSNQPARTRSADQLFAEAFDQSRVPSQLNYEHALYYHSEMQFVISLIDVSRRLCSVPKDARLKALIAELNLIDHNLPASLCIPLWCPFKVTSEADFTSSESDQPAVSHAHHKVVRISPENATILNSAERVPYMVLVEVLEDETEESFQALLAMRERGELNASEKRYIPRAFEEIANSKSESGDQAGSETSHDSSIEAMMEISLKTSKPSLFTSDPIEEAIAGLPVSPEAPLDADDFAERMRTAAIMLAQLAHNATLPSANLTAISLIRENIIKQMETLEKNRLLDALQMNGKDEGREMPTWAQLSRESLILEAAGSKSALSREDPSATVFSEPWEDKCARVRASSAYGNRPNWRLLSVIVKSGTDMRQEQLACQIIYEMREIWREAELPLWVYHYRVLTASNNGGLVETVRNSISIHSIKKSAYLGQINQPGMVFTLRDHFIRKFGPVESEGYKKACECFAESLAGYSLITYLLQVKDRHNGNILVDNEGHLVHIDFGFMLSNSPGYMGFESAPFKLSQEYIDILGGSLTSPAFLHFKSLLLRGFLALRKHADRLLLLVEIMQPESRLPCFYAGEAAVLQFRNRFQLGLTDERAGLFIERLVTSAAFNVFTKLYDAFQYYSNGIL